MTPRIKTVLGGAALALALVVTAWLPLLLSGNPAMLWGRRDLWNYFGPAAFYFDHSLHQGAWPWWNSHVFCGTPFSANPQASVFYPPNLLRALLNFAPTPHRSMVSLLLMQWAHLAFFGAGMALLCRSHRLSKTATIIGIAAFVLSGAVAFRSVQHWHFIACAAWLPWALWGIRCTVRARSRRGKITGLLLLGMTTGMIFLIGFPQLAIYFLVCCAAFGFFDRVVRISKPARFPKNIGKLVILLGCMCVLGILLALPMLLPASELAGHSMRAKGIGDSQSVVSYRPMPYLQHPMALLRALIWFPGANSLQLCGVVALFLALVAFFRRGRTAWPYIGLFLVMIDCAMGPPWPCATLVSWLAPFDIAETERAVLFVSFSIAMLAAFGMDSLKKVSVIKKTNLLLPVIVGILGVSVMGTLLEWEVLDPEYPIGTWIWGMQLLAVAGIIITLLKPTWRWGSAAILLGLLIELAVWNQAFLFHETKLNSYPANTDSMVQKQSFKNANVRISPNKYLENASMLSLQPGVSGYDPLFLNDTRRVLCAPDKERIYDRQVYSREVMRQNTRGNNLVKRRFWLVRDIIKCPIPEKDRIFPICAGIPVGGEVLLPENTSVTPGNERITPLSSTTLLQSKQDKKLLLTLPAFPAPRHHAALRLWLECPQPGKMECDFLAGDKGTALPALDVVWKAGSTMVEIPLPDTEAQELQPCFRLDQNILPPEIVRAELAEDQGDENNLLSIAKTWANGVVVRAENLPEARWLVFTESAYPGWTATVNGQSVPITKVFGVFQAVRIPAGNSEVRFEFLPFRNLIALAAGAAGWLGCLALLMLVRMRG